MPFIAYLDETGDHSLELVDKDFPIFALAMLICENDKYIHDIIPATYKLKMDFVGHDALIIHSRDIRKNQNDFTFLTNPELRKNFYGQLNQMMTESDYVLIASVIHKQDHKEKYGAKANNPYDLALTFVMERLVIFLELNDENEIHILAESRGKNEDQELRKVFFRIINHGTRYLSSERFLNIRWNLKFVPKKMNIIGTQLADLAAYPIARFVLNPDKDNPAFEILKKKFFKGKRHMRGLKVFPQKNKRSQ